MGQGIGGHQSSRAKTTTWLTPPHILDALGHFDLDPCAHPDWMTADSHICLPDDGLAAEWAGDVWLNPPYGAETWAWLDRLAEHGSGIALIFARTETAGFIEQVWKKADALLFLHGRLHFHNDAGIRAATNSGGPSVLIAYGDDMAERLRTARLDGTFVPLATATQTIAGED